MALNKEYFDAIQIDVVKKKYYNANKVEAVLADIRRQAAELTAENERMRQALSALADRRVELGDAMLSAQGVYRTIVEKANARAAEIEHDARQKAAKIAADTQRQQDEAVQRAERLFTSMKAQHQAAIDAINAEWQEYLCGLYGEEAAAEPPEEPEQPPEDLAEKVGAIARELFEINDGEEPEEEPEE